MTEQPFSRAWTTILAERHVAPIGGLLAPGRRPAPIAEREWVLLRFGAGSL